MHVVKSAAALVAGLLASTAAAFVIVPEITGADDTLLSMLPVDVASTAESQTLKLNCPGCPVRIHDDIVVTNAQNHLELNFRVDHTPDFDRLVVNDFELYPNVDPFGASLVAPQIIDMAMRAKRMGMMHKPQVAEVPLGYKMDAYPIAKEEEGQVLELVGVDLQIIEVANTFVDGLPNIHVQLIKDGEKLAIAQLDTTEPKPQEKCETIWCMFKEMMGKGAGMFKMPCPAKMKHGHGHGHGHGHMNIPGHGHHHHHHHGEPDAAALQQEQSHRGFIGVMASIVAHVILPVLIGIVAGVTISLIAVVIGSVLLALFRLIRGQKVSPAGCPFRRMCHKSSTEETDAVDEEKSGLMDNQEHQDPPPSYEDAPRA